jgi:multidrug resistance efflux pump
VLHCRETGSRRLIKNQSPGMTVMKPVKTSVLSLLASSLLAGSSLFAAEVNALLAWADARTLGTSVSARIETVNVKPGVQVSKDTLLVELDRRYFENRKARAAAAVKAAKMTLDEARLEQGRAIELYDRTVLSQFDRRKADRELATAEAGYADAVAELKEAGLDIEYSTLSAPFDAVILAVNAAPGEVVLNALEARPLVRIARAGEMLSVASLTGEQLRGIEPGQSVEVAFRGNWLNGTVDSVGLDPMTDSTEQLYRLAVRFSVEPGSHARAGEASAIRLP